MISPELGVFRWFLLKESILKFGDRQCENESLPDYSKAVLIISKDSIDEFELFRAGFSEALRQIFISVCSEERNEFCPTNIG